MDELTKEMQWKRLVAQNLEVEEETPSTFWKGIFLGFLLGAISVATIQIVVAGL